MPIHRQPTMALALVGWQWWCCASDGPDDTAKWLNAWHPSPLAPRFFVSERHVTMDDLLA
jgi:hypothetical protein